MLTISFLIHWIIRICLYFYEYDNRYARLASNIFRVKAIIRNIAFDPHRNKAIVLAFEIKQSYDPQLYNTVGKYFIKSDLPFCLRKLLRRSVNHFWEMILLWIVSKLFSSFPTRNTFVKKKYISFNMFYGVWSCILFWYIKQTNRFKLFNASRTIINWVSKI